MTSNEIRAAFLSFFESKGHKIIPSSSLIPKGDPTLLLTTAGMVQFKPYFLGEATPPSPRLASCQKCFRTTDIESVGDPTHLTFFEMLGNFSIGNYFKKEAISWAWEFVTKHLKLPPERLWITIFLDDEEAFTHWREIGIPEERIIRLGEKDNFWGPAGDSGPCGPCSEIHYDFGEEVGCQQASCAPGCDCGRFSEIWNLVFTQYNQDKNGKRTPLPKPNIDTGMGLERTAAVVQGKTSVYETDLFAPLLEWVSELAGKKYGADKVLDNAMRVIAEHSRGIAFLISDGVMPSNEGRGYVLRRLLRRAALFGRRLGLDEPFLAETAKVTIKQMGHVYPELEQRWASIHKVVDLEEERFSETLNTGLELMSNTMAELASKLAPNSEIKEALQKMGEAIGKAVEPLQKVAIPPETLQALQQFQNAAKQMGETIGKAVKPFKALAGADVLQTFQQYHKAIEQLQKTMSIPDISEALQQYQQLLKIPGEGIFKLYDTYGFPAELIKEIAAERGFSVDLEGFEKEMEKQRERARKVFKVEGGRFEIKGMPVELTNVSPKTSFVGYNTPKHESAIINVLIDSQSAGSIEKGQEASLILEATPFYGEMGGQVGDIGEIRSSTGRFSVTNTIRVPPDIIVHQGHVTEGSFTVGDRVEAEVDRERRLDIARNHTSTHLLQAALRQVLGEHIQQRGSLVAPERFRFDFSHLVAMTKEEIRKVNNIVNDRIRQNLAVYDEELPYKKAIEEGVIALFDEKYGDVVRVLRIGRPVISAELCGGTHVSTTGEIGFFNIISESSIGAGLRRIEAVTGREAEEYIARRLSDLEEIAEYLETKPEEVVEKAHSLSIELKNERRQILALESELAKKTAESLLNQAEVVNGVKVLVARVPPNRIEALRGMSDLLREQLKSVIVVLGTVYEDKPVFLAAVTPDLVGKGYNAGEIVKQVAKVAGGGGGGKATLAQAGGKYKDKLDEALRLVKSLI